MKYEVKIEGAPESDGTIDFRRLAFFAESMLKISEGALQIRLRGVSLTKGRKKISLKEALKISLSSVKAGSTVLYLESEKFEKTLKYYPMDLFQQEIQRDLSQQTPVTLFFKTFQIVFGSDGGQDLLDKPLLRKLKRFEKVFLSDSEVFTFSGPDGVHELKFKKEDFKKIKELEEKLPDPKPIVLNGVVEELKYSKLKVRIRTTEGIVDGFLSDALPPQEISPFWGKEVTITGTVHFKPGGKTIIEIERVFVAGKKDKYFSKKPKVETITQQLVRQIREKGANRLSEIIGKWPGDEDYDELRKMITK